eukprot:NODE_2524_length_1399_cov_82.346395_g2400_i0.p1 GENE.NODE_2524_length_1399_cov_82.346395_g2400_i0~~NODE_2524_length_1399_cov_82.346395_g2400_i0.p1  ORF type:complete len:354 (-),score=36.39 NODE_2524_length_1399_cov_82.346395_g2400_i0:61-1122(-)
MAMDVAIRYFCSVLVDPGLQLILTFRTHDHTQDLAESDSTISKFLRRVEVERQNGVLRVSTHALDLISTIRTHIIRKHRNSEAICRAKTDPVPPARKRRLEGVDGAYGSDKVEVYRHAICARPDLSWEEALQRVADVLEFQSTTFPDASPVCTQVSLWDGDQRISYPATSVKCRHIQCFDLEKFLPALFQSHGGGEVRAPCPVCSTSVRLGGLRFDHVQGAILRQADPTVRFVEVHHDGSWVAVTDLDPLKSEERLIQQQQQPPPPPIDAPDLDQEFEKWKNEVQDAKSAGLPLPPPLETEEELLEREYRNFKALIGIPHTCSTAPPMPSSSLCLAEQRGGGLVDYGSDGDGL